MVEEQLPDEVVEFADYLHRLLEALDPEAGWYGVFAQRDPDGMRACLEGKEVLPWDVADSLLQDLAIRHGTATVDAQRPRAQRLHSASAAAYDRRIGGKGMLQDRLDVMLREEQYAASREREVSAALALARTDDDADRLSAELAWARDDHARATARCAELRGRLETLARQARPHEDARPLPVTPTTDEEQAAGHSERKTPTESARSASRLRGARFVGVSKDAEAASAAPKAPASPAAASAKPRKPKPRGARFAGISEAAEEVEAAQPVVAQAPVVPVAPRTAARAKPRGARFAGAYGETADSPTDAAPKPSRAATADPAELAAARRAAEEAVARLSALRASGRGSEAYVVLCEAAAGPAERLPMLVSALEEAGLAADVATLLWEAACLPPPLLVAGVTALADAGRMDDCRALLRQAVGRPATEVAETVLTFRAEGRTAEAGALLHALLRGRSSEEAVRVAEADPAVLVPLLLDMADRVSPHSRRDLAHVLRVAGVPGVPGFA